MKKIKSWRYSMKGKWWWMSRRIGESRYREGVWCLGE